MNYTENNIIILSTANIRPDLVMRVDRAFAKDQLVKVIRDLIPYSNVAEIEEAIGFLEELKSRL